MTSVLIGHTGFVGAHLARDEKFDLHVNRANLDSLAGRHVDRLVCAGLPAAKWIANSDPAADLANVERLEGVLSSMRIERFVLISTIDVYPQTRDADEDHDCSTQPNHAYGAHRLRFENFVRTQFPNTSVVRLPALFGTGLKKNVIYDLLHNHQLDLIQRDSSFQWYPLERLTADLRTIETHGLSLVNLFTEPLSTAEIVDAYLPDRSIGTTTRPIASYDLTTRHGKLFGGNDRYAMTADVLKARLGEFIAKELRA